MKDSFDPPIQTVLITVSSAKKKGKCPNRSGNVIREFLQEQSVEIVHEETLEENKAAFEEII